MRVSSMERELDQYYTSYLYWLRLTYLHFKNFIFNHAAFEQYRKTAKGQKHLALYSPIDNLLQRKKYKGVVVYPPTIEWDIPLIQRPQHLAAALAARGYLYFYCTNNIFDSVLGYKEIGSNLILTNQYSTVISKVNSGFIFFQASHSGYTISDLKNWKMLGYRIIYEYIDEINPELVGTDNYSRIMKRHNSINDTNIDLAVVSSKRLYDELKAKISSSKIIYLPNGVDYNHFNNIAALEHPDIDELVKTGKPVIGYYGALAKWIDYDLIRVTALNNPGWNIVLIGWNFDNSIKELDGVKNIHLLGIKSYDELPGYLSKFDVCIIPFKKGNIAKSTSPLKLFEYMSGGKQVVVTKDLHECRGYKGVYIAASRADFTKKIKFALNNANNASIKERLHKQGRSNSWERRASQLDVKLQAVLDEKTIVKGKFLSKKMLEYGERQAYIHSEKLALELAKLNSYRLYRIWSTYLKKFVKKYV